MKPDPSYAPIYCALYPGLAKLVRIHGYALAVHGSLARDFDLICVPWVEVPSEPQTVVDAIVAAFAIKQVAQPESKEHGRMAFTISIGFGECYIDLSFTPRRVLIPPPDLSRDPPVMA